MAKTPSVKTRRHRQAWRPLLIGIVILIGLFVFNGLHPAVFELADLKASDLRMYVTRRPPLSGAIAIAAIDEKSVAELGHWPWPRSVEARLSNALRDYQAAVVGYDVLFSESDEDDAQAARIATHLKSLGIGDAAVRRDAGHWQRPGLRRRAQAGGFELPRLCFRKSFRSGARAGIFSRRQ